jgi:FkbM family methyltransferase
MNALKNGTPAKINNKPDQLYSLSNVDPSRIQFIPAAIWKEKTEVKFYEPFNNSNVSHSTTNFQKTLSFIKVPAETLSGICARAGIQPENIDILKLDIEGAEYDVIQWITQSNIRPKQILVEFDELNFANRHTAERVKASVGMLNSIGYRMAHFDGLSNCTFVGDTLISD